MPPFIPTGHLVLTVALPALLAVSAFISGTETALFSLTRHQRLRLSRQEGLVGAAIATLLTETRALLITLLLVNMAVNVLYYILSTIILMGVRHQDRIDKLLIAALSLLFLSAMIVLGEVAPKLVASRIALAWVNVVAIPTLAVHRLVGPVRVVLSTLVVTPLARLVSPGQKPPELSPDEMGTLLEMSQKHGLIDPGEEQLLQGVLSLSTLKVRDLMTPRVDVKAFDLAAPPAQLIEVIRRARLSRIPVYEHNLDQVLGIVNAREALLRPPTSHADLRALIRQVNFVPEQQRGDDLLLHFRKTGTTLAMVVDEYGGTNGLVTLVDVVEPLIGQIPRPAAGVAAPQAEMIGLGIWRVSADLSVHDWAEAFGQTAILPGVATLGGLVMARLGRLPRAGDRTAVGNLSIEVEKMKGRRIDSLVLSIPHGDHGRGSVGGSSAAPSPKPETSKSP